MSFEVCLNQTSVPLRTLHSPLLFSRAAAQTSRTELSGRGAFSPSPMEGRMRVRDSGQRRLYAERLSLTSAMRWELIATPPQLYNELAVGKALAAPRGLCHKSCGSFLYRCVAVRMSKVVEASLLREETLPTEHSFPWMSGHFSGCSWGYWAH